jgi:hypothetical protein
MFKSLHFSASVVLWSGLLLTSPVRAEDSAFSEASLGVGLTAISLTAGVPLALSGDTDLLVTGFDMAGETAKVTLTGIGDSAARVIVLPHAVVGTMSIAVGQTLKASATAGGHLIHSGQTLVGFIAENPQQRLLFSQPFH